MLDAPILFLSKALVEKMVKSLERRLQYAGIHLRSELMMVDCRMAGSDSTAQNLIRGRKLASLNHIPFISRTLRNAG